MTPEEWEIRRRGALDQLDLYTVILPGLLAHLDEITACALARAAEAGVTPEDWDGLSYLAREDILARTPCRASRCVCGGKRARPVDGIAKRLSCRPTTVAALLGGGA